MTAKDRLRLLLEDVTTVRPGFTIQSAPGGAFVVDIDKVVDASSSIKRTIGGVLTALGITIIKEDIEREIDVKLKKIGTSHNLYEVIVPLKKSSGEKFTYTTYQSRPNNKLEGESDDAAAERIKKDIIDGVVKTMAAYTKAIQAGNEAEAKAIFDKNMPDAADGILQWQQLNSTTVPTATPSPYTKEQATNIHKLYLASVAARHRQLTTMGLLSRNSISKILGIDGQATLLNFVVAKIQRMADSQPGWDQIKSATISVDDLNAQLPSAVVTTPLALGVIGDYKEINQNQLSKDAIEAIAAATMAVSAGIKAANKKIEDKYASTTI